MLSRQPPPSRDCPKLDIHPVLKGEDSSGRGSCDRLLSWLTPGSQSLARLTSGHRLPTGGSEINPSLTDVDRGVQVCVVLVPAADADEYGPQRTVGRIDQPAHRPGQARVR